MPHIQQNQAALHGIRLDHDFQQAPVGGLGGRRIEQASANPPRGLGRALTSLKDGIKDLGNRFLNAVTPHGVRSEAKFRTGLKETSAEVGKLLQAMSTDRSGATDAAGAQQIIARLGATASPLTSRGADLQQVIEARIGVHLNNMTPAERQALHSGLDALGQEGGALRGDPTLATVRRLIDQRALGAGIAALQQGIDAAIALAQPDAVEGGDPRIGEALDQLYATAQQSLRDSGFGHLPAGEQRALQRAIVKQTLEERLHDPETSQDLQNLATLISKLPSSEMHALLHATPHIGPPDLDNVSSVLTGALSTRSDMLAARLSGDVAQLGQMKFSDDPQGFARQLGRTAQTLADLHAHSDLHQIDFPASASDAHARAAEQLYEALDSTRAVNQLVNLSTNELLGIEKALQQFGIDDISSANTARQNQLGNACVTALQKDIDLAVATVAREAQDKGITGRAFEAVYDHARSLLQQHGFGDLPVEARIKMEHSLALQALEARLSGPDAGTQAAPVVVLLNHLPTKELRALSPEGLSVGSLPPAAASHTAVLDAISSRSTSLQNAVTSGLNDLLARPLPAANDPQGMIQNPKAFAVALAQTGQALADLRQHSDVHGLEFPPAITATYAQALDHLEKYLADPDNQAQLGHLDSTQLGGLMRGLRQLGVENGAAAVNAEANTQRREMLDAYAQVMEGGFEALLNGDTARALHTLEAAKLVGDRALGVYMNLGMKADGADELADFRDKLLTHAVGSMSQENLQAMAAIINSPPMAEVENRLADLAMALFASNSRVSAYDSTNLGKEMFNRSTDIAMLRRCISDRLVELNVASPLPDWANPPNSDALLREVYGISASRDQSVNVYRGIAGEAVHSALRDNCQMIIGEPEKYPPHDGFPALSDAMVRDLPRATYQINTGSGPQPLFDHQAEDRAAALRAVDQQLQQLAGGNAEVALLASRLANQNVLAGLQDHLTSRSSLTRLSDGTPGRMMGEEDIAYTLRSDNAGGILLRVDFTSRNATHFLLTEFTPEGEPIVASARELDPARSNFHIDFTLRIGADLSVNFTEPTSYAYELAELLPQGGQPMA